MEEDKEAKIVRDARGEARRTARRGGGSYQQCLDKVAQERGHLHWKDFMVRHEAPPVETIDQERSTQKDDGDVRTGIRTYRPLPYQEWRSGLGLMTRDESDERRVERVALAADRLSARTGMPLWLIGAAPMLGIGTAMGIAQLHQGISVDNALTAGVSMMMGAIVCIMCFALGNIREMGNMRSTVDAWLSVGQTIALLYLMGAIGVVTSTDPKVLEYGARFYGSLLHTTERAVLIMIGLQLTRVAFRWTLVVATRHPSVMVGSGEHPRSLIPRRS
jgi:hypothetical protein